MDTRIIPCPDCGATNRRNYSAFLSWFAEPQRDMQVLLRWVRTHPCTRCAVKRCQRQKRKSPRVPRWGDVDVHVA